MLTCGCVDGCREGGDGWDRWGFGARRGLVAWLPGELGRVKRRVLRAWVIGAGCGRLTRVGESGRWSAVVVMGLWGLGAGSLAAFRLGRRLQSSIRSRGADQGVVRCPGAQSRLAAVLSG